MGKTPSIRVRQPSTIVENNLAEASSYFTLYDPEAEGEEPAGNRHVSRSPSNAAAADPVEESSKRSLSIAQVLKIDENSSSDEERSEKSFPLARDEKKMVSAEDEKEFLRTMYAMEFPVAEVLPGAAMTPIFEKPMPNNSEKIV